MTEPEHTMCSPGTFAVEVKVSYGGEIWAGFDGRAMEESAIVHYELAVDDNIVF